MVSTPRWEFSSRRAVAASRSLVWKVSSRSGIVASASASGQGLHFAAPPPHAGAWPELPAPCPCPSAPPPSGGGRLPLPFVVLVTRTQVVTDVDLGTHASIRQGAPESLGLLQDRTDIVALEDRHDHHLGSVPAWEATQAPDHLRVSSPTPHEARDTPQDVFQPYSSLPSSDWKVSSNCLEKFWPRKWDVPACSARLSCIMASHE